MFPIVHAWCELKKDSFRCGLSSAVDLKMNEGDFWNNLDALVEQQKEGKEMEKVGDWLKNVPDPKDEKAPSKATIKSKSPVG